MNMITPFTLNGYYEYALKGDSQKTGMAVVSGYVNLLTMECRKVVLIWK